MAPEWLFDILVPAGNTLSPGCTFHQLLEDVWKSLFDSLKDGKNALAAREAIISCMTPLGIPQADAEELAKNIVARPFGIVARRPAASNLVTLRPASIPEAPGPEPGQAAPRKPAQRSGNTLVIIPEAPAAPPPVFFPPRAKLGKPCNTFLMEGWCDRMDSCLYDHKIKLDPRSVGVPGSTSMVDVSRNPCHTYLTEGWCRFEDRCLYTHYETLPVEAEDSRPTVRPARPRETEPAPAASPPAPASPTPAAEPTPEAAAPGGTSPLLAPRAARRQKFVPISTVLGQSPWGARAAVRPPGEEQPAGPTAEAGHVQEPHQGELPGAADPKAPPGPDPADAGEAGSQELDSKADPPPAPLHLGPSFERFIMTAYNRDSPGMYLCYTASNIKHILKLLDQRRTDGLISELPDRVLHWRPSPSSVQTLYTRLRKPLEAMQENYDKLCNTEPLDVEALQQARLELRLARWQSGREIFKCRNLEWDFERILDKLPRVADFQGLHLVEALVYLLFAIQRLQRVANHTGRFQIMSIITGSAPLSVYSTATKRLNRIHIALATDLLYRGIYFKENHNPTFLYLSFRVEPQEMDADA
ncbi:hypothetical protein H696_05434 [Fonticula alba]|uniref:C3H1-type domain-containing protein n=1 Tax=Fonticula alba TaxID=691883 RepID=A0A058Z1K0_FONAL|nr:hypothetical protein H696_05434 [Fonticula alba]KCV67976.1 hypothetical protein H696_05434 [Fonticula alba]|eukprot:XP_009497543.1 hypothetical protein H696_05434 [Fonticula alba]